MCWIIGTVRRGVARYVITRHGEAGRGVAWLGFAIFI
jgi:hypothetical protein